MCCLSTRKEGRGAERGTLKLGDGEEGVTCYPDLVILSKKCQNASQNGESDVTRVTRFPCFFGSLGTKQ